MDEENLQEEIETRLGIYGQIFDEYYNRQLREHEYAPIENDLDRFNARIGGSIMYDEDGRAIIHN